MAIAGVILAGGKSTRMGKDKSTLLIGKNNLIQHSKKILKQSGIKNIFISGAKGIKDTINNKGPIAGIAACMQSLAKYDYILFMPVDMPLLNKYVLLKLISEKKLNAVFFENRFFPLLINNNAINRNIINQQLNRNKLSIKNMLHKLDALTLVNHFPESTFLNANTPKDWQGIQSILHCHFNSN